MGQHFTNEEGEQVEIDVAELQEWYKKFVVECPSGTLFMHEFKRFFGVHDNQEAADYVENMFKAFDKNGDNTIDFLEYVAALNLVLRGKLEHKLRWTFKMYDKDGNGCIDKPELLEIVEAIYRLKQAYKSDEERAVPGLTPEEVVERIFELVDENGDGNNLILDHTDVLFEIKSTEKGRWQLTRGIGQSASSVSLTYYDFFCLANDSLGQLSLDEFLDGAQKDKWVMKMLQIDVSPGGWIAKQRRSSALF